MKISALSLVAALAVAAPAFAVPSVAVRVGDLDLTQASQASVMLRRLDVAAAKACGAERGSLREMQVAVRRSGCYAKAMDRALADLNAPTVTSLYEANMQIAAR
jgi:UrcA family protein